VKGRANAAAITATAIKIIAAVFINKYLIDDTNRQQK
jgi:hypothetical protein